MITLTRDDAELVADAVLKRSDLLVDAVVKRLAARERVQVRTEKNETPISYLCGSWQQAQKVNECREK